MIMNFLFEDVGIVSTSEGFANIYRSRCYGSCWGFWDVVEREVDLDLVNREQISDVFKISMI